MFKSTISAAALSLLVSSVAWAAPAVPRMTPGANSSDLVTIDKGDHDRDHRRNRHKGDDHWSYRDHDHDWYRGYRHRYSYRPYDWEDRGCINVGPVWYCS